MLFRPEEVHVRSPVSATWSLDADGSDRVCHDGVRLDRQYLLVAHHDSHGLPAVQTGRVHPHCFAWEEPADRQRFKPSLCEPFLLPIDRNAVLVRQVIKRSDRHDLIRLRMEKERIAGRFEIVKELSPFFDRDS
jgi:hypothetical protein